MSSFPGLYPPRDRSTNIELIKSLRAAHTQEEFEAADERIATGLHPSLLAELDWMEMTMPTQQRTDGARLVDGLFLHYLPTIMSQRKIEFDLSEEDLRWEISANIDFYRNLVRDEERPLDALGDELSQRIQNCLQNIEPDIDGVISRMCQTERPRIVRAFSGVEDPNWILLMADVEIQNALAKSLDHVTSRIQTKQFMRHIGGQFPSIEIPSIESNEDLQLLLDRLGSLEALARKFSVYRLVAVCRVLREMLVSADVSRLNVFGGELAAGYGTCGTCSMMYASSAIVSYDPACPRLFEGEDDRIYFPIDFNVSVCLFCGEETRANVPSMFYSPKRNQVIYSYPRLGQFSETGARDVHRPAISALRERYIDRISDEEAAKFEAASEEFTYSALEFLAAIQMGTTVKEEHVSVLVRFHDGSGVIVDPTKGATIGLTRTEMKNQWAVDRAVDLDTALKGEGIGGGPLLKDAMEAFAAGQYERSRDILEELHKKYPGDEVVRKNLAVAYVTLGDKESARRVLGG